VFFSVRKKTVPPIFEIAKQRKSLPVRVYLCVIVAGVLVVLFRFVTYAGRCLQIIFELLVLAALYIWCQINRDQVVTFWFGTRFKVSRFCH